MKTLEDRRFDVIVGMSDRISCPSGSVLGRLRGAGVESVRRFKGPEIRTVIVAATPELNGDRELIYVGLSGGGMRPSPDDPDEPVSTSSP
ncbi:MAG: hypothetical protein ACXQTG_06800 [Methanoculleaceae archaeon]